MPARGSCAPASMASTATAANGCDGGCRRLRRTLTCGAALVATTALTLICAGEATGVRVRRLRGQGFPDPSTGAHRRLDGGGGGALAASLNVPVEGEDTRRDQPPTHNSQYEGEPPVPPSPSDLREPSYHGQSADLPGDGDGEEKSGEKSIHDHLKRLHERWNPKHSFIFMVVHLIATYVVAYLFQQYRSPALGYREPEVGRYVFGYGLFDEKESCCEDRMLCFCSICFSWHIQWADTVSKSKVSIVNNFWVALGISLVGVHELNHFTMGASHILWVALAVYYRQKIREKFGLDSGSLETYIMDAATWCCCPCLATAQEARQVEHYRTIDSPLDDDEQIGFRHGNVMLRVGPPAPARSVAPL